MKKLIILIVIITTLNNLIAQSCLPFGITFSNQEQIDNFPANHPNCTEIEGKVIIESGPYIKNLNGLSGVTTIGEYLFIWHNDSLTNLIGLDSLEQVGEEIRIYNNDALESLTGLERLKNVGERFLISDNNTLINLKGLINLSNIGEYISITKHPLIKNLEGLDSLKYLPDGLKVMFNDSLISLTGLQGLDSLGGNLKISYNDQLTDLSGINNIKSINEDLYIDGNDQLMNFSGLESLKFVGGRINITSNNKLKSLSGLDSLECIGISLRLYRNDSLENLGGLSNLKSVDQITINENLSVVNFLGLENLEFLKSIVITNNESLLSLSGLDNINSDSVEYLNISNNNSLSDCAINSFCNLLSNPNSVIKIHHNDTGCNSPPEIASKCGFTMPCLPLGDYYLCTQQEIDSFQSNYPGCTELQGNVIIQGDEILNLNGLDSIISISSSLNLFETKELSTLSGLDNLLSIGRDLSFSQNDSLLDLTSLENLTLVSRELFIEKNTLLTDLNGINNIEAEQLESLYIIDNPNLSICHVLSICTYLELPESFSLIWGNAIGCDSESEILDSCEIVQVDEIKKLIDLHIYPNPATNSFVILNSNMDTQSIVKLYNSFGQLILKKKWEHNSIDISMIKAGIYILELETSNGLVRKKIIIE